MIEAAKYPGTQGFFNYAIERYQVFLKKEGQLPPPWTDDPILREFRFCNVFREDDLVTRWFRQFVREPLRDSSDVIFATIAFRFFNTIKTGMVLMDHNLLTDWDASRARSALSGLKPLVTGAYMVKTPIGVSPKLEGLIQILDPIWRDRHRLAHDLQAADTLELAHARLCEYPWVGPFMGYEFVTDLRHTYLLEKATDIMTWANPGPGAMRGLNRIVHGDVGRSVSKAQMQTAMQDLLEAARPGCMWPGNFPQWEMREVEHTLCEYDKYMRAVLGEGQPKQRYRGA